MKTYIVQFDEDRVVQEIEETAKVAHVTPEEFIAGLVARTVAPHSKTARQFFPEPVMS